MTLVQRTSPRSARRHRAAELFQVLAEDPEQRLFLLDSNALGFAFRLSPLEGADSALRDRLNVFFNQDWPTDTLIQISLFTSPDLKLDVPNPGPECPPLESRIAQRSSAYLRSLGQHPIKALDGVRLHRADLILSVVLPLRAPLPTDAENTTAKRLQSTSREALEGIGLRPETLDGGDWIRLMEVLFDRRPDASWRQHSPRAPDRGQLLREQILDFETPIEIDGDAVRLPHGEARMLSVKRYPDRFSFGGALRYLGDLLTGSRGLRETALIGLTLHYPDIEGHRQTLSTRRQWITTQSIGPMARFVPRLAVRKQQFDLLFDALDEGDRPVRAALGLALLVDDRDAGHRAVTRAKVYFRELGFQLLEDRYIALPAFLNLLPLGAERSHVRESQRFKTLATRHAIPLMPLFADWAGSGTPLLSLISRSGALMQFSLFDSPTNYNASIAAQSGAGKSFLTNELILRALAEGMRVWVIDIGRSYQNLAESLGGQFLSFSRDTPLSMNPFKTLGNWSEEADLITALIAAMAAPNETLSDFQSAGLKQILRTEYEARGASLELGDIASALSTASDPRLRDLGLQLDPFTADGEYGAFFTGEGPAIGEERFTVLELEGLQGRRALQQVVLLQLILGIQQAMIKAPRQQKKLVIIDEAWDLLTDGPAARFIEHGYRRFRKYGGAAITLTQSVNDLYRTPVGRAIVENSAHLLLLGQKAEAIEQLRGERRLPLGEAGLSLLKSVHTLPGRYSEVFIFGETGAGIGRLVVDPFKRLLFSTRPDDLAALADLRACGLDLETAIETRLIEQEAAA